MKAEFPYLRFHVFNWQKETYNTIKQNGTMNLYQWSLFDMAELYKLAGDYETAIDYLNQFNHYAIENNLIWKKNYIDIELYCLMGKYDSALHYLQSRKMKNQDVTKGKKSI